jgi:hypothetical protein
MLMVAQRALAAGGTIFTPGPIVINDGNTAIVKVSNRRSTPLANVVILAIGGKDLIEFQRTLSAIRPFQTVDVLLPFPRDPRNWQPLAFVPTADGQDHIYFDLFTQQGNFGQAVFADPPTAQYPNKLWRMIAKSEFTAAGVLTYGELEHVSGRTLGPINAGPSQPGDAVFLKNLGTTPIRAYVYCLDGKGQKVHGCGGLHLIEPADDAAAYSVSIPQSAFLVVCADGEANLLWANALIGSVDYPDELWDAHHEPDFCAGEMPSAGAVGNVWW